MLSDLFAWRFQILDSDSMQEAQRKLEDALVPLFAGDQGQHEAEAHVHLLGQLIGLESIPRRILTGRAMTLDEFGNVAVVDADQGGR